MLIWGMTDGTAEGGVISKDIKRIFQRVRQIIDENHEKNKAQNTALRNSSLESKRELIKGHMLAARGSLRAMSGDGLGYQMKRVW